MAISVGSGSSGRGRRRAGGTLSEINVVPLVDVMLVLLIIFMLTAQVMEFGLEIDVPKVKQRETSAQELPVISQTKSGELYLNEASVTLDTIGSEVRRRFGADTKVVYVRAAKELTWENLAQTIAAVSEAKFQARLVTKTQDISDKGR
jgi:biopolymer transport protein ExbD